MGDALRATKLRHRLIARRSSTMASAFTERFACLLAASLLHGCNAVAPSMAPTTDVNPRSGVVVGTEPYIWAQNPATHLFTMKADGTDKRILTDDEGNRTPAWTCDGRQILVWLDPRMSLAVPLLRRREKSRRSCRSSGSRPC